jgi:hypothetical protein
MDRPRSNTLYCACGAKAPDSSKERVRFANRHPIFGTSEEIDEHVERVKLRKNTASRKKAEQRQLT